MQKGIITAALFFLFISPFTSAQEIKNGPVCSRQQKWFDKLHVSEAWKITKGNPEVLIGCIDNGFDFYHPCLRKNLIPGYYAAKAYHSMTFQTIAHGTLVAGLMVANQANGADISGLAPECKVLTASIGSIEHYILKKRQEILTNNPQLPGAEVMKRIYNDSVKIRTFSSRWNEFSGTAIADGITYLTANGVRVINISAEIMASYAENTWEKITRAIEYARLHDVLLVIAAGNGNTQIPDKLKNYCNLIIVGACTGNGTRWTMPAGNTVQGSNWGNSLDLCAPTDELWVCLPSDKRYYEAGDGPMGTEHIPYEGKICDAMPFGATSAAAPVVSSLAALLYSAAPGLTANEVKKLIIEGCDDIGDKGFDVYTRYGCIDFGKTIALLHHP